MLKYGHFDSTIQDYLGIPASTFYGWLQRGKAETDTIFSQFSDTYRRSRAVGIVRLHRVVFNDALRDVKSAQWMLARKDHKNYAEKSALYDIDKAAAEEVYNEYET